MKAIAGLVLIQSAFADGRLKETEFAPEDALRLLNAQAWSFSYAPTNPIRRIDLLIYEERTDESGKSATTVRHACMLGMIPKERVFSIKMLLAGQELHASIDAASNTVKLSDEFRLGAFQYREGGGRKADPDGRRRLIEIGNRKKFNGKPPFKIELKFKIFEDLDQPALKKLLDGSPPETASLK